MLVVHRRPDGPIYRRVELFTERDSAPMEGRPETLLISEILPAA
jgi:hypothetical protein